MIAICPDCNHEFLYKGHAKRPRVHCPKCKKRFYIATQTTQKESITNSTQKNQSSIKKKGTGELPPPPEREILFSKVDDDMIEKLILDKANSGEPLSDNFIKTCIYFYKDIRGKDDKIHDDIDMEDLKLIGESL